MFEFAAAEFTYNITHSFIQVLANLEFSEIFKYFDTFYRLLLDI